MQAPDAADSLRRLQWISLVFAHVTCWWYLWLFNETKLNFEFYGINKTKLAINISRSAVFMVVQRKCRNLAAGLKFWLSSNCEMMTVTAKTGDDVLWRNAC